MLETELENDELAQYILDLFKAKEPTGPPWMCMGGGKRSLRCEIPSGKLT